jgi:hypothetical protein
VIFFLGIPTPFVTFTRPILNATMSRFLPVHANRAAETCTVPRETAATPAVHEQVFDSCFLHYLLVFCLLATELQKYVMCKYRVRCLIMQRWTKRLLNVILRLQNRHHNHRILSFRCHNSQVQVSRVKHCKVMHVLLTFTETQDLNNAPNI